MTRREFEVLVAKRGAIASRHCRLAHL